MRGRQLPDYSHDPRKMELLEYVEEFFTALHFWQAFDWKRQPARWRQAMNILSMTWEIGRLQLTRTAYEK